MWRAECLAWDFAAVCVTRAEADAALVAHIRATTHLAWIIAPVPARPAAVDGKAKPTQSVWAGTSWKNLQARFCDRGDVCDRR